LRLSVGEETIKIADKLSGWKAVAAGLGLIAALAGLVTACVGTLGLGCALAILAIIGLALGTIDQFLADDDERDELERKQRRIEELSSQLPNS